MSLRISTQWLPTPNGNTSTNEDGSKNEYPSAFISIQVPVNGSNSSGNIFSCSVDARWALGTNVFGFSLDAAIAEQCGSISNTRSSDDIEFTVNNFLPIDDGSWQTVHLGLDWLNTLTPQLDSNHLCWTSLADMLRGAGVDNSTGLVSYWGGIQDIIEGSIATLVADGMSRVGYSANGGSPNNLSE